MASAGTVTVDFAAETAKFTAELKKVNASLKSVETSFDKAKARAAQFLGAFTVGAISAFVKAQADAGEELTETANKIGLASDKLQAFQLAAKEAGVEMSGANKLLLDSQKKLGEAAQGTGAAAETIRRLGLNIKELQKLQPDELFKTYATAITNLSNRSEQLAAASALMGKGAVDAFGLIQAGAPAIDEAAEFLRKFGLAATDIELKQLEQANETLARLGMIASGAGKQIAVGFAPFLEALAIKIQSVTGSTEGWKTAASVAGAVIQTAFAIVSNAFYVLKAAAFGLSAALWSMFASAQEGIAALASGVADVVNWLGDVQLSVAGMIPGDMGAQIVAALEEAQRPVRDFADGIAASTAQLGADYRASAAASFDTARGALADVQSIAQIQDGIVANMEASAARAAAAVAAQQQSNAGGAGSLAGDVFGLSAQQEAEAALAVSNELASGQMAAETAVTDHLAAEFELRALHRANYAAGENAFTRAEASANAEAQLAITQARDGALSAGMDALQTYAGQSEKAAKALVLINKGRAIAEAIQNTYLGATRQLTSGDPYTATVRAALVVAFGLAQVASIAKSAYGQMAQISAAGGAPVGSPSNPVNTQTAPTASNTTAAADSGKSVIELHVHGNYFNGRETTDYLITQFREEMNTRDVVLFSNESRQAQEMQAAGT